MMLELILLERDRFNPLYHIFQGWLLLLGPGFFVYLFNFFEELQQLVIFDAIDCIFNLKNPIFLEG